MARKALIEKEKRREKLVSSKWEKREALRKKSKDMKLTEEDREEARLALNKMSPNTSKIRLRNRCQLTGRARGNYRKFKLSRLCFREKALKGEIPGVTKASW
ncbi:MAG: 30S ribosomal protein S14 [Chlamydiales bacterium]|nr:30S ribosomal protein S14 [Chlamydiia bacterium]MCP5508300.1 30S ribosomal protein S14 [Chlamydiales bacterium]